MPRLRLTGLLLFAWIALNSPPAAPADDKSDASRDRVIRQLAAFAVPPAVRYALLGIPQERSSDGEEEEQEEGQQEEGQEEVVMARRSPEHHDVRAISGDCRVRSTKCA